jgi:hypothetical protein
MWTATIIPEIHSSDLIFFFSTSEKIAEMDPGQDACIGRGGRTALFNGD